MFVRKFSQCYICKTFFDDGHQYCPKCLMRDTPIIQPLWKKCTSDNCPCSNKLDLSKIDLDALRNMQCNHSKRPCYKYCLYCPPAGVIADAIHFGIWDKFYGVDEESLVKIADFSKKMQCHNVFTTSNMRDIANERNMKNAAQSIDRCLIRDKSSPLDILISMSSSHKTLSVEGFYFFIVILFFREILNYPFN